MHKRPVDNVDSRVRSPTYGLKKMHGVLSRARLVRSRIQTGAPASWGVLALSQFQLVHRPAATFVLDTQGAAGILAKSSDERKSGEAFPQSRLVSQTKQSHLTWCIGSQTSAAIRRSRDPGPTPGEAARRFSYFRPLAPALATCPSCVGSMPETPIAPMILPSTIIGTPPS